MDNIIDFEEYKRLKGIEEVYIEESPDDDDDIPNEILELILDRIDRLEALKIRKSKQEKTEN